MNNHPFPHSLLSTSKCFCLLLVTLIVALSLLVSSAAHISMSLWLRPAGSENGMWLPSPKGSRTSYSIQLAMLEHTPWNILTPLHIHTRSPSHPHRSGTKKRTPPVPTIQAAGVSPPVTSLLAPQVFGHLVSAKFSGCFSIAMGPQWLDDFEIPWRTGGNPHDLGNFHPNRGCGLDLGLLGASPSQMISAIWGWLPPILTIVYGAWSWLGSLEFTDLSMGPTWREIENCQNIGFKKPTSKQQQNKNI